ncbi:MAG: hypothetical protein MK111_24785, partial [Crocosphaera sp.]|uniref:hypothetical protein n=1 Tax=Crocosphaera sp. TaxID=2729996 RepID=UPI002587BAB0
LAYSSSKSSQGINSAMITQRLLGDNSTCKFPVAEQKTYLLSNGDRKNLIAIATKIRGSVCSGIGQNSSRRLSANLILKRVQIWLLKFNYKNRKIN